MKTAQYWIDQLNLTLHPEGSYFKESYRAPLEIKNQHGNVRSAMTGIYFLMTCKNHVAFHRIQSDEFWHHHDGVATTVYVLLENGGLQTMKIGTDIENGEQLQGVVPAGAWFASVVESPDSYSLTGCTVAPGFDFEDYESADADLLIETFPQHKALIQRLT